MLRAIALAWSVCWLLLTAASGWFCYEFYWRWRSCFNEEGNCFTGEVVHHEQNAVMIIPPIFCAAMVVAGLIVAVRSSRRRL